MRKYANIDKSNLPIVRFAFNAFTPTVEEFLDHQKDTDELLEAHDNVVIVFDFTNMVYLPTELRILQGKYAESRKELVKKKWLGMVFMTPTIMGSLMLKGALLINKPKVGYIVVRSMNEAMKWAQSRISQSARVTV